MDEKKDKRVKLSPEQKGEIKNKSLAGISGYRLAKDYGVSETTIYYLLDPKKLENNRKKEQKKEGYKEKNRIRQERWVKANHKKK